jgi:hypothetical protein
LKTFPLKTSHDLVVGLIHNRAVLHAVSTSGTKIHVDTARLLFNFYFEIACRSFDRFEIRIGNDFDVEMPADLDQFG